MARAPLALITGASSGIGIELANVFAAEGHDLVLVARRQAEMEALADQLLESHRIHCHVLPCDLAREGAVAELIESLPRRPVDVLVNNAGVLRSGRFAEDDLDRQLQQVRLNVLGLTELTYRCLGPMLKRGRGRIVNLASVAGFQPVPSMAVYAATKAYVLHFSEALAEELKGTGVSVTAVCPGFTDTPMLRGTKHPDKLPPGMPAVMVCRPADVAREAFDAAMAREVIRVPGMAYKTLRLLSGLQPRAVVRNLLGTLTRRAGR